VGGLPYFLRGGICASGRTTSAAAETTNDGPPTHQLPSIWSEQHRHYTASLACQWPQQVNDSKKNGSFWDWKRSCDYR